MVIEAIAKRLGVGFGLHGPVREARSSLVGSEVRLLLPQTYMNRSGSALMSMSDPPHADDLVVVYDDVDLPVGAVRIRLSGGSGGHRGVLSLIDEYGPEFVRVRIGVGRPPEGTDTADYVLAPMSQDERDEQESGVIRGAEAVECIISDGVDAAMCRFNGKPPALPS
jgi:PTH1 family peptidyl-tRNA hydrolase